MTEENNKSEIKYLTEGNKAILFDRKKAEDIQTIIDSVPAMVFYKDKENRFIRTNKIFEDAMGLPKEKLEGRSLFEIFPKEQADAFWKDDLEVLNSGRAKRNIIEPMQTPNGIRFLQTDKIPHFDENGNSVGIIGFAIDITERKKNEDALRESEEKYKELVENANSFIFKLDINGKITFCNESAEKFFGFTKEEMYEKDSTETIAPKIDSSGRDLTKEFNKIYEDPNKYSLHINENVKKNGERVWIAWSNKTLFDANQNKIGHMAIGTDITERIKNEDALKKSQARTNSIINSIADSFYSLDKQWRFTTINAAAEKAPFGQPAKNLIGKVIWEVYPNLVGTDIQQHYLNAMNKQIQEHYEAKSPLNGRWYEVFMFPQEESLDIYLRDIDERKKNEKELKRLASFPELNPNPILELDLEGNILYQNPAIMALFPDLLEKSLNHPWLADFNSIAEKLPTEITIDREIAVGSKYYHKKIHYLADQNKIRIYGVDITEQKEKEDELKKLNRTLRAISNSNQMLMKATSEASYLKDVCKTIIQDCGYKLVWIGYTQDNEEKSIKPVAHAGFEEGYLETLDLTYADTERGQGPTGTAIRTGGISVCENMQTDPKFIPWRQEALKRGYSSSIVFPMKNAEEIFGAISIYSEETNPFSEKEIILLKELVSDISYGVTSLRTNQARVAAEEMLQKNEASLQTEKKVLHTIMNNTQAGLAYIDKDFNFVTVNSVFCENNGRSEEELLGKNYFDFFPSEENKLLFERVRDGGQQIKLTQKPSVLKGKPWQEVTYWDWTLSPVKNDEGHVYGLVVSLVDVSERVKSIEDLKIHGHKLERMTAELKEVQTAVENASDIIFITDDKGKIIYVNRAVKKILGYKQKELIGRKPNFWMEDMPNKFFGQMWQAIYFNKEPFVGEIQDRKKDGDIFTAEIRIAPVLDKNSQILSFVGIERDITEAKRLDTAKTEFISLAAHQLRTPITTVSLTAEMLIGGLSGKMSKESEEYLHEIMDNVRKMSEMIEMFLNVSRIEMKTFEVIPQPSSITKIVEDNIKSVMPQIKAKQLEFKKNIPDDLPIINVDHKVMNIVLENLLSNAIKYTPSRGLINVEAEKYRDSVIIKVSDTGCGIPKKQQPQVFEKLFRAENAEKKAEGVGLGLYLCKSLIEQTGGKIWLTSEKDAGTTFYISIPLIGMKKNKR